MTRCYRPSLQTSLHFQQDTTMAKKTKTEEKLLTELLQHYRMWTEDNERRMHRDNGWNDVTDAYYGVLPDDWPYITRMVDPRIRTTLLEKNARLLNSKLRGTLVPREDGDTISASINNAVLNYQWETANDGGSMLMKIGICDMDARLYASKFALVKWKYEVDDDDNVVFDGNEIYPLDIRDSGMDPNSSHIRNAKWFQHRSWEYVEDLEDQTDAVGTPRFKNLDKIKRSLSEKLGQKRSSTRTTDYVPRGKTLRGMEDRVGEDRSFPQIKVVTEYRPDRWITFSPDYEVILRDIPNPYAHKRIPIAQLRYYPLQDDPLGESEVEPVLDIWRAIQATLCGYMDESILKMRPPLKVIEGAARVETIQYGPETQWLVTRQDAIEEMNSNGDSLQYFQTTYQALVSAFNVAMGDLSQGISNFGPFEDDNKTATEIKASVRQQNTRDQKNQNDLGEFIKEIMLMWCSNNKQFLFSDSEKKEHVIRIVGADQYNSFVRAGMDQSEVSPEAMQMIGDIIEQNPDMTDTEIQELLEVASVPKYPVVLNPAEKDPAKLKVKPKLSVSERGDSAELSIVPEDLEGTYDYIPDVKSMSIGASEELERARQAAIALLTSNETVLMLLQEEGFRPNVKELISSTLQGQGLKDTDRFFRKLETNAINQQGIAPQGVGQMAGTLPVGGPAGIPGVPAAGASGGVQPQMAGPQPL